MSASPLLRAYLVDDEPLALKRLSEMLRETKRVQILGKTTDAETALHFLCSESVDILLLDIQMPGMNGFELLAKLPAQPMVIFTTAHNEHALEAFRVNSIDYLLKPVEPNELDRALDKAERLRGSGFVAQFHEQLQAALAELAGSLRSRSAEFPDRIASRVADRVQFVDLSKISHFQSENGLTYAVTPLKKFVVDYTIAELERKLDPKRFVRVHRSTLLNLTWVDEVHSWFGGRLLVRLKGNQHLELTVARDRTRALKKNLDL